MDEPSARPSLGLGHLSENKLYNTAFKILSIPFAVVENVKLTEAVAQRCSIKKVFLEISQNSQENTCARVFF